MPWLSSNWNIRDSHCHTVQLSVRNTPDLIERRLPSAVDSCIFGKLPGRVAVCWDAADWLLYIQDFAPCRNYTSPALRPATCYSIETKQNCMAESSGHPDVRVALINVCLAIVGCSEKGGLFGQWQDRLNRGAGERPWAAF
jgi:hypothetical protein